MKKEVKQIWEKVTDKKDKFLHMYARSIQGKEPEQ